jgi:hypothetical protein
MRLCKVAILQMPQGLGPREGGDATWKAWPDPWLPRRAKSADRGPWGLRQERRRGEGLCSNGAFENSSEVGAESASPGVRSGCRLAEKNFLTTRAEQGMSLSESRGLKTGIFCFLGLSSLSP